MIPCPVYSTKLFNFDKQTRNLSAFASDLEVNGRLFGAVFNDACDEGLEIVSAHTGNSIKYYVNETYRNRDNDVTHYELKPVNKKGPGSDTTVTIWNT